MISVIRQLMDTEHEVVLWTTRNGRELEKAVSWCKSYGLDFRTVNCQAPSNQKQYGHMYAVASKKVYADLYIDDHNPDFIMACKNKDYEYAINYTISMIRRIVEL